MRRRAESPHHRGDLRERAARRVRGAAETRGPFPRGGSVPGPRPLTGRSVVPRGRPPAGQSAAAQAQPVGSNRPPPVVVPLLGPFREHWEPARTGRRRPGSIQVRRPFTRVPLLLGCSLCADSSPRPSCSCGSVTAWPWPRLLRTTSAQQPPPATKPADTKAAGGAPQSVGPSVAVEPGFTIGPEDVLGIIVWREQDVTADVTVRPDG